ncbi:MAG: YigZ family protein [Helicobacter sp.]|nr:YigZ family protein [Helicobacter sp.]
MFFPTRRIQNSIGIKGSTFVSFLICAKDFRASLEEIKGNHRKADHFVIARRFMDEQWQVRESFSDDGEPRGTSGMPTLKVMQGYDLIECGILTVRYFGGTLLGTGGLSRAYTKAAQEVIEVAKRNNALEVYNPRHLKSYFVAFSQVGQIENLCHKLEIEIVRSDFEERGMAIDILATRDLLEQFDREWASLQHKA